MKPANFEQRLKGGHPNSLGNTVEIVSEVLSNPNLFESLFLCYHSDDPVVRLRTSNAMKRIAKDDKAILIPYIDRLIKEISKIYQASAQWTLAQLFALMKDDMTDEQIDGAIDIMKVNLAKSNDWIVLSQTMSTLAEWSTSRDELRHWLQPHLVRLENDKRKSVSKRATKLLKSMNDY